MSIADHFEHAPDAGFVRDYTSDSARRQFRVSLVLLVVISLAATGLGLLISFDGPSHGFAADQDVAGRGVTDVTPTYAGKL